MISHFLGIDHAGHSFNVEHSEMEWKLREIDIELGKIAEAIDKNTTLLIFGDHGMIDEGNHGGSSEQERSTLLFSYSKGA